MKRNKKYEQFLAIHKARNQLGIEVYACISQYVTDPTEGDLGDSIYPSVDLLIWDGLRWPMTVVIEPVRNNVRRVLK